MGLFWTTVGDDWIAKRNAYIRSMIGDDPSQSLGGGQNPMDMDQATMQRIGEAHDAYQKQFDAAEEQWFASLPEDQAKQAYD